MKEKGQSLLELILAVGIFTIIISGLAYLVFDSYFSGLLAEKITKADFLAQEGLEAVRSIRDNNFDDLTAGFHGLAISAGHWVFQGNEEDIDLQLKNGKRTIEIEDIGQYRKKITSTVNWRFSEAITKEIKLLTYFTNWQKVEIPSLIEIRKPTAQTDFSRNTTNGVMAYDYPDGTTSAVTRYDVSDDPSIVFHTWQLPTKTYASLVLKYRYQADATADDRYAVAYSVSGCAGLFIDLISLTSSEAGDTTVSADLSSSQDLSQLCLKIYTQRTRGRDRPTPYIYTRDIWTEGSYTP